MTPEELKAFRVELMAKARAAKKAKEGEVVLILKIPRTAQVALLHYPILIEPNFFPENRFMYKK